MPHLFSALTVLMTANALVWGIVSFALLAGNSDRVCRNAGLDRNSRPTPRFYRSPAFWALAIAQLPLFAFLTHGFWTR